MVWIRSRAELLRLACNQHKLLAECGQTTRKPKIDPVRGKQDIAGLWPACKAEIGRQLG